MKTYATYSETETNKLAQRFAKNFKSGVISLTGKLGAGKTTFVQGFAKGLGVRDKIISPTFVLIRQHKIPDIKKVFYHIDLYRLEGKINIKELGIEEIIYSNNLVLIEWAEKIEKDLPKETTRITFEKMNDKKRLITISQ